jgi:hypothetical protein
MPEVILEQYTEHSVEYVHVNLDKLPPSNFLPERGRPPPTGCNGLITNQLPRQKQLRAHPAAA